MPLLTGLGIGIGAGLLGLNSRAKKNKLERDRFEYEQYVTENAASIRAKDLERAGLSKTLAAGNGATSAVSSTQQHHGAGEAMAEALQAAMTQGQISKTRAETDLSRKAADKAEAEKRNIDAGTDLIRSQIKGQDLRNYESRVNNVWLQTVKQEESQLRRANTDLALQNKVNAELEHDLKGLLKDQAEVDLAIKGLTLAIMEHDYSIYKEMEVPTNDNSRVGRLLIWYRALLRKTGKNDPHIQFKSAEELIEHLNKADQVQPDLSAEDANKVRSGDFQFQ